MKTISEALTNYFLDTVVTNRADLITIVLPNGQVLNVSFGTNVTSITYPVLPATVTTNATSYPWLATDPTYPFAVSGGGTPVSIAMSQGQIIILQYASGTQSLHLGEFPVDANGGAAALGGFIPSTFNDFSCPGQWISPSPPPMCLIGGFANASKFLIAPPFFIGNNALIGPAPQGTTQLLIGPNDNFYSDNSGNWVMNIVPMTYYSSQYGAWERGPFENKADFKLEAGTMKLTGFVPESFMYPGTTTPLMQVLLQGGLTGAKVIIQTLFWPLDSPPSSGFSMGTMQLMQGQVGNVKNTGRSIIECEVFDLTYILNRPFPPHMIQSACRHTFCDAGCTLIISNYASSPIALESTSTTLYLDFNIAGWFATTVYSYGNLIIESSVIYMATKSGTSGGTIPTFNSVLGATTSDNSGAVIWTSMGSYALGTPVTATNGAATQAYPLGYVLGVTGQNTGLTRTVKAQTSSSAGAFPELQLLWPLPFPVATGDTFKLVMGCDKTTATCENIYNNLIHFGGEPFVPNPEIAS